MSSEEKRTTSGYDGKYDDDDLPKTPKLEPYQDMDNDAELARMLSPFALPRGSTESKESKGGGDRMTDPSVHEFKTRGDVNVEHEKSVQASLGLNDTWICEVCSLENPQSSGNCAMCLSARPAASGPALAGLDWAIGEGDEAEEDEKEGFRFETDEEAKFAELLRAQGEDALQRAIEESELAELSGCPALKPTTSIIQAGTSELLQGRTFVPDYVASAAEREEAEIEMLRAVSKLPGAMGGRDFKGVLDRTISDGLESKTGGGEGAAATALSIERKLGGVEATVSPKSSDAAKQERPPWSCPLCTYQNPPEAPVCGMCETQNPSNTSMSPLQMTSGIDEIPIVAKPGEWVCTACTMINSKDFLTCQVCHTPSPSMVLMESQRTGLNNGRSSAHARTTSTEASEAPDGATALSHRKEAQPSTTEYTRRAAELEQKHKHLERLMGEFVFLDSEPIVNLMSFVLTQIGEDEYETDHYMQPILKATNYRASTIAELRGYLGTPRVRERIMTAVLQAKPLTTVVGGVTRQKMLNPLAYTRLFTLARALGTEQQLNSWNQEAKSNATPNASPSSNTMVASLDALIQAAIEDERATVLRAHHMFQLEQHNIQSILNFQGEFVRGVYKTVSAHVSALEAAASSIQRMDKSRYRLFQAAVQLAALRTSESDTDVLLVNNEFLRRFAKQLNLSKDEIEAALHSVYGPKTPLYHMAHIQTGKEVEPLTQAGRSAFATITRGESLDRKDSDGNFEQLAFKERMHAASLHLTEAYNSTALRTGTAQSQGEDINLDASGDEVLDYMLQERIEAYRKLVEVMKNPTVQNAAEFIAMRMKTALMGDPKAQTKSTKGNDKHAFQITEEQKRFLMNQGYYMKDDKMMTKNRQYVTGKQDNVTIEALKREKKEKKEKRDKKKEKKSKNSGPLTLMDKPKRGEVGFGLSEYLDDFDDPSTRMTVAPASTPTVPSAPPAGDNVDPSEDDGEVVGSESNNDAGSQEPTGTKFVEMLVEAKAIAERQQFVRKAKVNILADLIKVALAYRSLTPEYLHFLTGVRIRLGLTRADEMLALSALGHTLQSFRDAVKFKSDQDLPGAPIAPTPTPAAMADKKGALTGGFYQMPYSDLHGFVISAFEAMDYAISTTEIIQIYQNDFVMDAFEMYLESMIERDRKYPSDYPPGKVVRAWFPLYRENGARIYNDLAKHGFRREFARYRDHAELAFGNGLLFYTSLDELWHNQGSRHVQEYVLADVILGVPTKPSPNSWPGFRVPSASITYDSFVDNFENPRKIMIFDDFQAIPLAVVSHKDVQHFKL